MIEGLESSTQLFERAAYGSCPGDEAGPVTNFDAVLKDNGGPTLTHALLVGSNAIDLAGNCGLATDQRGAPRFDGNCDIGAFEFAGCPVLVLDFGMVTSVETYEECEIRAGGSFAVLTGGTLGLTGAKVVFYEGFEVDNGGELTVSIDSDLQLLAAFAEAERAGWSPPPDSP